MKNWRIQLHSIRSLPFCVTMIHTKPTLLIDFLTIRPDSLDQGEIKTNVLLSRFQNWRKKSRCKTCGLWRHWHSDHTPYGTLKPEVKALKTPLSQPFMESKNVSSKPLPYKKTITFNMPSLMIKAVFSLPFHWPFTRLWFFIQGLRLVELKILFPYLRINWICKLDPLPPAIANGTHWQYSSGRHSSDSQRMLRSIMIFARLNAETMINIGMSLLKDHYNS